MLATHPMWDNTPMTIIQMPKLHEQRKVEKLLIKPAKIKPAKIKPVKIKPVRIKPVKIKPVSATPAPVLNTKIDLRTA